MVTRNLFSFAATAAKTLCLVAAAATALSLASCSDDDDDGGASGTETEAGVITDTDGNKLYLTSADWMRFDYDSDWQLTGWGDDDYYYFDVSYDPLYMEGHFLEGGSTEETTTFSNFSINSDGYITKFTVSVDYSDTDYDESYSETSTLNLTYDSSGQLTKIVTNGSYKETYEGETYSGSGSGTYVFAWSDGMLTSSTYSGGNSEYDYTESVTYDYGDKEYANSTRQYVNSTAEYFWGDYTALAFLGYFGVGTTYLPVAMSCEEEEIEDGDTYQWTYNDEFSYGFNDNGTVNWEDWDGEMVYYTYSDGSSSTAANVRAATSLEGGTTTKARTHGSCNFLRKAWLRHKARISSGK